MLLYPCVLAIDQRAVFCWNSRDVLCLQEGRRGCDMEDVELAFTANEDANAMGNRCSPADLAPQQLESCKCVYKSIETMTSIEEFSLHKSKHERERT